ncbi:MAG: hypothetical protein KDD04_04690 [Sinomicrobium sp.]|nr:hypothetical protein [Sinomicrobium sp.]
MEHTKNYIILPARIARTSDPVGYFQTFYEACDGIRPNREVYQEIERQREVAGLPAKYSTYSSFRKAKHCFDAGKFSGQVRYI